MSILYRYRTPKCYSANKLTPDEAFIDEDDFYNEGTRRGLANDRIANLPVDQRSAARLRERERIERWIGDQAAAGKAAASTATLPTADDDARATSAIDMATNSAASFAANTSALQQDDPKPQKRSFAKRLKSLFKHKNSAQQTSLPTVVILTRQR